MPNEFQTKNEKYIWHETESQFEFPLNARQVIAKNKFLNEKQISNEDCILYLS